MAIRNVVYIVHPEGIHESKVQASIDVWGRLEDDSFSVEITDPVELERIGQAHLAPRAWPLVSHTINISPKPGAPVPGDDYDIGDRIAVADLTDIECVEIGGKLGPTGFTKVPGLSSKLEEQAAEADAAVQRMIAAAGGGSPVSSPAIDLRSGIPTGKLGTKEIDFSWGSSDELDPEFFDDDPDQPRPWNPKTMEEPRRMYGLRVKCDYFDGDGSFTTGTSSWVLTQNGAPVLDGLFVVSVGPEEGEAIIPIFGPGLVSKGDTLSVSPIANGGHENGTVSILTTDPV